MRAADHRRSIPTGVKLHACLLLLGFTEEEITGGGIEWNHEPALALRSIDADGQIHPPSNSPAHIRPMRKDDHAVVTRGTGATTAGSDIGKAAKLKRIEKDPAGGAEFRRKLLSAKAGGEEPARPGKRKKKAWPKRAFPSKRKTK